MRDWPGLAKCSSEARFQHDLIWLLLRDGWLVYHVQNSKTAGVSNPGFPDVVAVDTRFERPAFFLELKSNDSRATPAQIAWLGMLRVGGRVATVARPRDWRQLQHLSETGEWPDCELWSLTKTEIKELRRWAACL